MKNYIIFILTMFLGAFVMQAQQPVNKSKNNCSCSFSSINQIGLVAGEQNESFVLQSVNGLKYKTWMVGAGVGIDGYRYRSVPVFFQLRKEFPVKGDAIFLYNDIGTNYPWLKSNQKMWRGGEFNPGIYYDGGIGYKVSLRRHALVFSSGFSLKKLSEDVPSFSCPFMPGTCQEGRDTYYYSLKRISFKVGLHL